jgi:hypothetical protein
MCKCKSRGGSLKALDWKYRCSSHLAVRLVGLDLYACKLYSIWDLTSHRHRQLWMFHDQLWVFMTDILLYKSAARPQSINASITTFSSSDVDPCDYLYKT